MEFIEIIKVIVLGIVEGLTEWIPISSTGHMILVDELLKLNMSIAFKEMFLVVIQLGAIMAVVFLYFEKINPFLFVNDKLTIKDETISLWLKIIVACVPAGVIGFLYDDTLEAMFYNYQTVAVTLIIYGILFIIIEGRHKNIKPKINELSQITFKIAIIIGIFQVLALIPGTSRSGATIIGAILIGTSRTVAAEFTFLLAIPIMFGASLLKLVKFGFVFTNAEVITLFIGMSVAFVVSILAIKFLMGYIKKHDFTVFGWYRIILGIIVILYFLAN
ncbi:MAG: undecaprenyl-diphosphate phosphatase [Clostridiaceae bacterium]|nr:undecaprenyl-diphosphate phosphatase [Clostridiaceae bacterium]